MTDDERHINDRHGPDELDGLPPDLRALDRELLSMEISERESFGPELEAELAEAWKAMPRRRGTRTHRRAALAASLATFLLVSLGVPPARAGLVRFLVAVQEGATEVLNLPDSPQEPLVGVEPPAADLLQDRGSSPEPPPALELAGARAADRTEPAAYMVPTLADRERAADLLRSFYPEPMKTQGVGGAARLLLWVDARGRVAEARLRSSSGVVELDRAALAAAPTLRFEPALREGRATGTWLEFDVRFQPQGGSQLPSVTALEAPETGQVGQTLEIRPEWLPSPSGPPVALRDAEDMLREALDPVSGPGVEELLEGGPPTGPFSLRWREEATETLEEAILRDPSNPAPFLALARIRRKQGLRSDALRLYDRGIERALAADPPVPPAVAADLYFERAVMIREGWLPWRHLGEMPSAALQNSACTRGPSPRSSQRYASDEILVAWNFRCPSSFDDLMRTRLEPLEFLKDEDRQEMLVSLYDAVEADPGHLKANTELLLAMAEDGRWSQVLERAHYFLSASDAHPYAQLLIGLALHRLGRSQDASVRFYQALAQLPPAQVGAMLDISALLQPEAAREFSQLEGPAREEALREFWAPLDPLLTTAVNEREVEHMARAAYALLRFGAADADGGQVWIRYGQPQAIRAFAGGADERSEFWDYGPGPDLVLRRPASGLQLELTSETETYLDQLREVFPHRYAPSAREVLPLASQRARFRSEAGEGMELELHTRVPEELLSPLTDSLELGVFLLSSQGTRYTVERRHIAAEAQPVNLRVPVRNDANRVVVEIFEPETGRAAALRSPISAREFTGAEEGVQISDLLLVQAASPFNEGALRRAASWVEPLTAPTMAEAGRVGVLFEVYGLPESTARYFLRVVVEDLDTGAREPVDVKPVGEIAFRPMWERKRRNPGRLGEYMTLDLGDLRPGAYLLRLELAVPDIDVTVERSRALEIG